MIPSGAFLDTLKAAADGAARAENALRREIEERTKALERERAFAFRERWHAQSRATSFWALFDQYVRETPVVDF